MTAPAQTLTDDDRHRMVHPHRMQGCDLCDVPGVLCQWCKKPPTVCPDWARHGDLHRGSEITYWRRAA